MELKADAASNRRRKRALAVRPPALAGREHYERRLKAQWERRQAMASEQAVSAAHVSGTILKELDRLRGKDGAWTVELRPIRARDSWVFKAHTPLAPWPLAVKVFCATVTAEHVAANGDHLRRYHRQMAERPDLSVPAFWASLPEHRTLVMQWIDAPRMDHLLRRAGGRRDERSALFAAAGAWLRHYHAQSDVVERPLKAKSHPRHIDLMLGGDDGAGASVRDGVFRNGYEALVEHGKTAGKRPVAHVMGHGDFVPHNLFHDGERTFGFDMVPRPQPALNDICHFLVQAELKKPMTARRARLGPTGLERQDVHAFHDGYCTPEHLVSDPVTSYLQLYEALLRWAVIISYVRRARPRPAYLMRWMRYRRMVSCAAQALRQGRGMRP